MKKNIVVIGGTGGLGSTYVDRFLKEGYEIFIGSRNAANAASHSWYHNEHVTYATIDLLDYNSVISFKDHVKNEFNYVDYVINATGYDARKALCEHSQSDIDNSLDINLKGAIYLVKAFLPIMRPVKGSTIVNMGGFIDGSLAFPYYSADVASRAGLFSFTESMNRELKQENSPVRITYFCPNAANTDAERPYHPIWKEMKTKISTPEEVADALLNTLRKKKTVGIMGGFTYSAGAKLNHLSTKLSDFLVMNKYSQILKKHLGSQAEKKSHDSSCGKLTVAAVLLTISCLLYILDPIILMSKLPVTLKTTCVILVEIASWTTFTIAGFFGGKELLGRCSCK